MEQLMIELHESITKWLKSMEYNGDYGKFKMCTHAYKDYSLDASSLATDLTHMLGIPLTKEEKLSRSQFFDSHQDKSTGFFHEDFQNELDENKIPRVIEMSGTYLGFQVGGAYRAIDAKPKNEFVFYRKYIQKETMKKYMTENFPWKYSPWGAGGMVDSVSTMLRLNIEMGFSEYQQTLDAMFEWLDSHQDPITGFWGDLSVQGINGLINGGYHIMRGTYLWHNKDFKYSEKMIDTILKDLKENPIFDENNGHGCQDLDHFFLLEKIHSILPEYRKKEINELSMKRLNTILRIMLKKDGGFSFEANNAVKFHNYYDVSPGYSESDMQGTVFYLQTLQSINRILKMMQKNIFNDSTTHGTPIQ